MLEIGARAHRVAGLAALPGSTRPQILLAVDAKEHHRLYAARRLGAS
jgi:hypothetical protein